jgi:hypothetical protein
MSFSENSENRVPGWGPRCVTRLPLPEALDAAVALPLEAALAAARDMAPSVTGLAISGDELTIAHDDELSDAERERLQDLFGDRERLLALSPPAAAEPSADELRAVLRDEATPDAEWVRVFRRWAVAELIDRSE